MSKFTKFIISILVCTSIIFASFSSTMAISSKPIFESRKNTNYTMVTNEMIDTYIIAAAMFYDFRSPCLLPDTENSPLYKAAKVYFEPYKNHKFIQDFNDYGFCGDINGDVIGVLLSHSPDSNLKSLYPVPAEYRQGVFKTDASIKLFLKNLSDFYKVSNAHEFFKNNNSIYKDMQSYIGKNVNETVLNKLILETENYVGNKKTRFGKDKIAYQTVLTVYRPSMASFFQIRSKKNNTTIICTLQSPNDFSKKPEIFDYDQMINTNIHEILHVYINTSIEEKSSNIEKFAKDKEKVAFVDTMYQSMPWHRVVDENMVRAIEGRIYKNVLGEKTAKSQILEPQIKYGGFSKIDKIYTQLSQYELNRKKYTSIEQYMDVLIETLFLSK